MRRPPGRDRTSGARLPAGAVDLLWRELLDDGFHADRTSRSIVRGSPNGSAWIRAEAPGVLSGVAAVAALARRAGLTARPLRADGARLVPGTPVLRLTGDLRTILGVERTALNALMHLSGVATETARAVRSVHGSVAIFATRKTLPGLKDLQKAAVVHGGGHPHRRDLSDGLLAKSRHLELVPIATAVARLRATARRGTPVQVEVRSVAEARDAVAAGADALLIDNASPAAVRRVVAALVADGTRDRVWIEVSGGITPTTAGRYAGSGADALSLGALTHSAPALPFHLRWAVTDARAPA